MRRRPISELVQRLRARGWRITAQRRVVAEVLAGEHIHLTADAVYNQAQELLPEISLATVYNTLNELVEMGEVLEISAADGPKRYDPNTTVEPPPSVLRQMWGLARRQPGRHRPAVAAIQPTARLRTARLGHRLPRPMPRLQQRRRDTLIAKQFRPRRVWDPLERLCGANWEGIVGARLSRGAHDLGGEPLEGFGESDERATAEREALGKPVRPRNQSDFDSSYAGQPPWDIGRPQAAFVEIVAAGGLIGRILDVGCGTGEHTLLAAAAGHEATGIDLAPAAIERAEQKARDRDLRATFLVHDALDLVSLHGPFATVLDSGLFHVLADGDRALYEEQLRSVVPTAGRYYLLAFSDRQSGDWGPRRVTEQEVRECFAGG